MQQLFIDQNQIIDNSIMIDGQDAKHLAKVLRMQKGEILRVSTTENNNYKCEITDFVDDSVKLSIIEEMPNTESCGKIYLFQALPKGDRMETVIEKTVELGVFEIIPVVMKNCIMKLDEKKAEKKLTRYQSIAEAAAKQSKRSMIPNIHTVMTFNEAISYAKDMDHIILPYENASGMKGTTEVLSSIKPGESVAIFIGPEGGFAPEEIDKATDCAKLVSLGKRILRTDTAAILSVGLVMTTLECQGE